MQDNSPIPQTIADLARPRNKSGYYGVFFEKRNVYKIWRARIIAPKGSAHRHIELGWYQTPEQAAQRVLKALHALNRSPGRHRHMRCKWGHPLIGRHLYCFENRSGPRGTLRTHRYCRTCTLERARVRYRRRGEGNAIEEKE
jgi:hypothetical protein